MLDLSATAVTVIERAADRARHLTRRKIAAGELTLGPCAMCGTAESVIAHHPDYSRPLEIISMCRSCHSRYHREIVPRLRRSV